MTDYSSIIDAIRSRSDLVSVVSSLIQIKKMGKSYQGLCPFHSEKTPSFHVYPDRQRFHCYGCQKDGDIFSFLQFYHGWTFPQTVKSLAADLRLEHLLPAPRAHPLSAEQLVLQNMKNILETVLSFFQKSLKQLRADHPAILMLKQRNIQPEIIDLYQLGWAEGFNSLLENFSNDRKLLFESGLITPPERNKSWNRFVNRLIFPIFQVNPVQVVGFGGRIVEENPDRKLPKYLNSPDSAVFKKSLLLYGLNVALKYRHFKSFVIVEGYFDVIQMANHGLPCAIAPMGTALCSDHLNSLLVHHRELIFCFDGDRAGQEAAYKALVLLLPIYTHKLQASFVTLPPEHDPDSYLLSYGREKFIHLFQKRVKIGEYLFQKLSQKYPLDSVDNTVIFVSEAKKHIRLIEDPDARLTLLRVLEGYLPSSKSSLKGVSFRKTPIPFLRKIDPAEWLAALLAYKPELIHRLTERQKHILKEKRLSETLSILCDSAADPNAIQREKENMKSKYHAFLSLIPSEALEMEMDEQIRKLGLILE